MNVECPSCFKTNAIVWPQDGFLLVLTENGKPRLGGIEFEILRTAKELIAERLGVIAASRRLARSARWRHYVEPQIAELLLMFVGIDSETDTLPVGAESKQWDAEALEHKDREVADTERCYRESAIKAATELVRLLEARTPF